MEGIQVAIEGKITIIAKSKNNNKINGIDDLYICSIVVPSGATPVITNNPKPNGGWICPTSSAINNNTANHNKLKSRVCANGKYIGIAIIIMDKDSINIPIKIIINNSKINIIIDGTCKPLTKPIKFLAICV